MSEEPKGRVLVVEDDETIRFAVEHGLGAHGFAMRSAESAEAAIVALGSEPADVIVLDVGLPSMSGIELAERLRAEGDTTPILILSARDGVHDRILGLEAGADDYVVKPFDLTELTLRVRALLRRSQRADEEEPASEAIEVGPLRLDAGRRVVEVVDDTGARELELTRREFDLLHFFMTNPRNVLSRAQILEAVWGYDFDTNTNVVDVFVGYLRKKMDAAGIERQIRTVRGIGFALGETS